jgi:CubicO group peptidase (beta-lactamase class C family)
MKTMKSKVQWLVWAFVWAALAQTAAAETTAPEDVGLSSERLERIGELVARHVEAGEISGAVTLVARNGQVAHLEAHGLMDLESSRAMTEDAIFRIASMSKPVGAVAILMLIEEGKVRLNDPVSRFIPSYRGMHVAVPQPARGGPGGSFGGGPGAAPQFYTVPTERDVTVLDLLTHTSGVMSGQLSNSQGQAASGRRHELGVAWTEEIGQAPLEFQPGARWAYSALAGFDVLSRIVEIVSGQTFADFLQTRMFEPLGMHDTSFWPTGEQRERLASSYVPRDGRLSPRENADSMSGERYFSAAGGLMTTAADYARFGMMLANDGELDGARLLSPRSVELMRSVVIPDSLPGRQPGEGFGLGVRVVDDPAKRRTWLSEGSYGWSGLYGTHFWVSPREKLVGIILAQTSVRALLDDFETAVMQAVVE